MTDAEKRNEQIRLFAQAVRAAQEAAIRKMNESLLTWKFPSTLDVLESARKQSEDATKNPPKNSHTKS